LVLGSLEVRWVLAHGLVFFRSWLFGRRSTCVRVCNSPAFSRKKETITCKLDKYILVLGSMQ
jgi:hypothetical protein